MTSLALKPINAIRCKLAKLCPGIDAVGLSSWARRCIWNFVPGAQPRRVWLAITDHFEPLGNRQDVEGAARRIRIWQERWPAIADVCRDSADRPAKYSFFYPAEAYSPDLIERLASMVRAKVADIGVHLHHQGGNRSEFSQTIGSFVENLDREHGLRQEWNGRRGFGFIHGDWALDNSLPEGKYCGLDDEIRILANLGCYADFTMPAQTHAAQPRQVNVIYWAKGQAGRPKSYDWGVPLKPGYPPAGDLLMIPGPFGVRINEWWYEKWRHRSWRERITSVENSLALEYGEITWHDPLSRHRVQRWLDLAPRIGQEVFVKLFAHGGTQRDTEYLLGGALESMYAMVQNECRRRGWEIYFVSAWEMFRAVEAARMRRDPVLTLEALGSAFPS